MKSFRSKPVGWRYESHRHMLAAKGIKTQFVHRKVMSPDEREWRKVVRQLDDKTKRVRVRHYGDTQEFNPVFEESVGEFEHLDDLKKRLANEKFANRSTENERNAIENIYDKYFGGVSKRRYEVRKYAPSRVIGRSRTGTLAGTLANIYAGKERKIFADARMAGADIEREARLKKNLTHQPLSPAEEKLREERIIFATSPSERHQEYLVSHRKWADISLENGEKINDLVLKYHDLKGKGASADREQIRRELRILWRPYMVANENIKHYHIGGGYELDYSVLKDASKIVRGKKK